MSRSAKNITTDQTNDRATSPVAIQPATGSRMCLPPKSRITAPASGSAGTIQSRSRRSVASTVSP